MAVPETTLLLVRHPETEANVEKRFVGRGDASYTAEGERQFSALLDRIARFEPARIWTSPLPRASRLAETAAAAALVPLTIDERLVELDFGEAEGLTWDEIEARGLHFDYSSCDTPIAPGGESLGQIERRSAAIGADIVAAGGYHTVCTHGGVFRAMLVSLLGLSRADGWAFHIPNGMTARVRVVDGHGVLEEFGSV